jgi:hypothetical protein
MAMKPTIVAARATRMSAPGGPSGRTVEQVIQERKYPTGGVFKELFDIDGGIGNRELLNQNFSNPSTEAKLRNTSMEAVSPQMNKQGIESQKEISVSRSEIPPGIALDDMARTIYINADKAKVSSGNAFRAGFDNLLKSTRPEDQQFFQKYAGAGGGSPINREKIINAMAEQYQRLIDSKGAPAAGGEDVMQGGSAPAAPRLRVVSPK